MPKTEAPEAPVDDGCVAGDDWEPILVGAVRTERRKRLLVEFMETPYGNGKVSVEFSRGGCAHYGETFRFSPVREDGLDGMVAAAKSLLKGLRHRTSDGEEVPSLATQLDAATSFEENGPSTYTWACGEASCSIRHQAPDVLIVDYDFAL